MKIPSPITLSPDSEHLAQQLLALPGKAGVYSLVASGGPAHVSWSGNLARRLTRLLVSPYQSSQNVAGKLREKLVSIQCWPTCSKLDVALLTYELTKAHYPNEYMQRLRLRTPWFVNLNAGEGFARLSVANRIAVATRGHSRVTDDQSDGECQGQASSLAVLRRPASGALGAYGPFASRDAAQYYEEQIEGLFQIRRCSEALTPHPEHPGCIYGEMNQCLRPCQQAVTAGEYATEIHRVEEFLQTNGKSLAASLKAARERACEQMEFEQAAQLHRRIERVTAAAAARDEVTRNVESFHGVALTRGLKSRQVKLWPMYSACWQESVTLEIDAEEANAKSLDGQLKEKLTQAAAEIVSAGNQLEHLALFSRWYFSSWRDGSWFPFRTLQDLNYRRLVREISTMVKADALAAG